MYAELYVNNQFVRRYDDSLFDVHDLSAKMHFEDWEALIEYRRNITALFVEKILSIIAENEKDNMRLYINFPSKTNFKTNR